VQLGQLKIDVTRKDIKNVHLSVHPPTGRVRIAAPRHLSDDAIRVFVVGKLRWIRLQQGKLREQERETPREYLNRETHYVWGHRCLLSVVERDTPPSVEWRPRRLTLYVRPGTDTNRRAEALEAWYRGQLRTVAAPLVARLQQRLGVRVTRLFVQRMRTRWGSCNAVARTVRLNTELAKKPAECLEYVLIHEMAHILESTHNARFVALMDQFMPDWPHRRELLNRLPVRHEDWGCRGR
jgi:predicted metal-dependent hydrolase